MFKRLGIIVGLLFAAAIIWALSTTYVGPLVNENLSINKTYTVDLGQYKVDYLSWEATFSTVTLPSVSFVDGIKSTASLTVTNYLALSTAPAAVKITITSNNPASLPADGATLTLNGIRFTAGPSGAWRYNTSYASMSAISLINAINKYSVFYATAATGGSVIYATTTLTGTYLNSWIAKTSTPAALSLNGSTTLSTVAFSGGQDNASLVIGDCRVTNNKDFYALTSSATTGTSIANAIGKNCVGVTTATASSGVLTLTAVTVGTAGNLAIASSTQTALTFQAGGLMTGGKATSIVTSANEIQVSNYGLPLGSRALLSTVSGTPPGQLIAGTTYYIVPITTSLFKLASSTANAIAGTAIAIATQTAGGGGSFLLTPLAYNTATSTPTLTWQVSNDGSNYVNYSTPFNYTVQVSSSLLWDFGLINYRYVRALIVGPTAGAISANVTASGRTIKK